MNHLTQLYAHMIDCFLSGTKQDYVVAARRYERALRKVRR